MNEVKKIMVTADSGVNPVDEKNMISGLISLVNDDGTLEDGLRDVKEINPDEITKGRDVGKNYRTACPVLGDYYDLFGQYLKEKYDIIHFCMSSGISEGSNSGAKLVAVDLNDEYDNKVHVIDSLTGAAGGTVLIEYAKYLVKQGYSTDEIVNIINEQRHHILSSFYVPDTTGFIYSGRHKKELSFKDRIKVLGTGIMKQMSMNTRVDFDNETGDLHFQKIYRGALKKQLPLYIEDIVNRDNVEQYDDNFVALVSMPTNEQLRQELVTYLEELKYFKNVINQRCTGVYNAYGCRNLTMIGLLKKTK